MKVTSLELMLLQIYKTNSDVEKYKGHYQVAKPNTLNWNASSGAP